MTTHEDRARQILEQAEQDNAEHPIGISKHRVFRIAEALAEAEAQRDRLRPLVAELLADVEAHVYARFAPRGTRRVDPSRYPQMASRLEVVERARKALADIDKETT